MEVKDATALVTGANRGLGAAFCRRLLERGVATVYAGARNPNTVTTGGVAPVQLDITSPADVAAAAERCSDVTLLINNAATRTPGSMFDEGVLQDGRTDFETNVFGTAAMCRAFAPVLAANGGGTIVNVLSALSWFSAPSSTMYGASKAAALSLTNAMRQDLHGRGIRVVAVHVGLMETDMAADLHGAKSSPDEIADRTLEGVEAGLYEILTDDTSRRIRAALASELSTLYPFLG